MNIKEFRNLAWREVYRYDDKGTKQPFVVFRCAKEGITLVHDLDPRDPRRIKVRRIYYRVGRGSKSSRVTDSPAQAVKWWNSDQQRGQGSEHPPGSPKSLTRPDAARPLR